MKKICFKNLSPISIYNNNYIGFQDYAFDEIYVNLTNEKYKIYDNIKDYLLPETFYEKFVFNKYKNKITQ